MTDDDTALEELARGPLDETDATTLQLLREAYVALDDVPGDLVERIQFSLALDELYGEVARMTRMPLDDLAVRSAPTRTETLTFSADRLSAMVTVVRVADGHLRLDGWLAPPTSYRVRLRILDGDEHETLTDDDGRFSFDGLPEGFGQLSFLPPDDGAARADKGQPEDAATTVVTPLFQL